MDPRAKVEEQDELVVGVSVDELLAESDPPTGESAVEADVAAAIEDSELAGFEAAEVENRPALAEVQVDSILESFLFANDRPVSFAVIRQVFKGTAVKSADLRQSIERLKIQYQDAQRGLSLEESGGGYILRTKVENRPFLAGQVKAKVFKLSGPALEVLSIVAYKQPCVKLQIDEIRGVESGHLLRGLMERGLVQFAGKSELPGKPMLYDTTRKFLEIFGLRNIAELPSLTEIDELIPEGIGDSLDEEGERLSDLTDRLSQEAGPTYSESESELLDITDALKSVSTTTEFFERERERMKSEDERKRATDIRQSLALGAEISDKDRRFLERFDKANTPNGAVAADAAAVADGEGDTPSEPGVSSESETPVGP
jgi:segregation and condensation protein B